MFCLMNCVQPVSDNGGRETVLHFSMPTVSHMRP